MTEPLEQSELIIPDLEPPPEQNEVEQFADLSCFDLPSKAFNVQQLHNLQINDEIQVKVTEINETDYCKKSKRKPLSDKSLTDKTNERLRFMRREINSKVLIDDATRLFIAMSRDERSRGLNSLMCRKTFFRLLSYLCRKKIIRLWKIEFKYQTKYRVLLYITKPSVEENFTLMKSCIEQAKTRFQLSIFSEESRKESMARNVKKVKLASMPAAKKVENITLGQRLTGNKSLNYGPRPKFVRYRAMHEFIFYLTHVHRNPEYVLDQEEIINGWKQTIEFEDIETLPKIWNEELDWRVFVPPLIKHNGFDKEWCLLSDCLFRMPLSIFVQVVNIFYEIPGLDEFLSHPIKVFAMTFYHFEY